MDLSYQELFESAPGCLTVQDRDFRVVEANRRVRNEFGDVVGRHCYSVYKRRSEKCPDCPAEQTFNDGRPHRGLAQVIRADGGAVAAIVETTPILDDSGQVVAVAEAVTDMTGAPAYSEARVARGERYRTLFNESPCYVSIQDRDLNIIDANRRFQEDFGAPGGGKCYKIYKHRDQECVDCPVQETFRDGQIHQSEEVVTAPDGRRIDVMVYAAPLRDAQGNIQSVIEMSANITQVRELQSKLASIGMLISSVSHGVKGLLMGMDGGIYLVETGLKKDDRPRLERGWEMVVRNVERIRRMMVDILYYAKDRRPEWERISAAAVAEEALETIQSGAQELKIELTRDIEPDLGEFDADPKAFRALLVNLLQNAVDACRVDERKDEHRVSIRLKGHPDQLEFVIEDNGVGMDRETREKAFSLFFSSKGAKGTGLGLFIADKIARAHGGAIAIDSEQGRGTSIAVKMPRNRPEDATEHEADAP